ncbi:MAG: site-2 protease family protein [Candidatus Omnitrophica bacterium]|nr:site-2 protease family protein [Candidatus Omnitrophota bacterium]MCM8808876.1 site-2 protease family protein [Candidatus Omnitrophota bacterium]MCM8810999.1 site-2 protease family protein [Candidatus Omnitrophota bacterium]MCM8832907.1 site-2 protease family protein [Candidatus Omnitrophota bacterium]
MVDILIFIVFFFFSVIIHEVSHGYVALKNGDPTAKYMGRLTLNPIPHIDPIGTILLPFLLIVLRFPILIGIAKPVPINPYYFRNYKIGMITVGISGPLSNILLGISFALIYKIFPSSLIGEYLKIGSFINFILAFFNLMPIPPLDGSRVIAVLLPRSLAIRYERIERYGIFLILFLAMAGFLNWLSLLSQHFTKFLINL